MEWRHYLSLSIPCVCHLNIILIPSFAILEAGNPYSIGISHRIRIFRFTHKLYLFRSLKLLVRSKYYPSISSPYQNQSDLHLLHVLHNNYPKKNLLSILILQFLTLLLDHCFRFKTDCSCNRLKYRSWN